MKKEDINILNKCKKQLSDIDNYRNNLPFTIQKYGLSQQSQKIDFILDEIHSEMFCKIIIAFNKAEMKIQKIIDEL